MFLRGKSSRGATLAIGALALLATLALLGTPGAPASGPATPKGFWAPAFRLQASNGYSVVVFPFSSGGGKGYVDLLVSGSRAGVTYQAPAVVTRTTIRADLGELGSIDVERVGSGAQMAEHSQCDPTPQTFESGHYRGAIEFNGEEGYTTVTASRVRFTIRPLLELSCPGFGSQEVRGAGLPGARLRALARRGGRSLSLQINKNQPMARATFNASVREQSGSIRIQRAVQGAAPAGAFAYDPALRTATVSPPAPFSGSAMFRRGDEPGTSWTGSLSVDFPGRSGVALTGGEVKAHLVHAQRRVESPLG